MHTVTISSKTISQINLIYRKIQKEFKATGEIKINPDTLQYELQLIRHELDPALKAICNKVLETYEMMNEHSVFSDFSWAGFLKIMEQEKVPVILRSLKVVWNDLNKEKRRACFHYLCEEMRLEAEDDYVTP